MFGAVVFAQGLINYFTLFTDYGFNLLGPKEIAQNDVLTKLRRIFILRERIERFNVIKK